MNIAGFSCLPGGIKTVISQFNHMGTIRAALSFLFTHKDVARSSIGDIVTRHLNPRLLLATAIGLMLVSVAPAGTITFTDTATGTHGTGFANVYNLLTFPTTRQHNTKLCSSISNC